jgi:hypothetical protein
MLSAVNVGWRLARLILQRLILLPCFEGRSMTESWLSCFASFHAV